MVPARKCWCQMKFFSVFRASKLSDVLLSNILRWYLVPLFTDCADTLRLPVNPSCKFLLCYVREFSFPKFMFIILSVNNSISIKLLSQFSLYLLFLSQTDSVHSGKGVI